MVQSGDISFKTFLFKFQDFSRIPGPVGTLCLVAFPGGKQPEVPRGKQPGFPRCIELGQERYLI